MRKNFLPYIALGLIVLLGLAHFIAEAFYIYWTVWWFDNLMHFFAGFALGFVVIWLLFRFSSVYKYFLSDRTIAFIVIGTVLLAGVAWEVFESINGIVQFAESATLDTTLDLIFDFVGATLASVVGLRSVFRAGA